MVRKIIKILVSLLGLLFIFSVILPSVQADGCIFIPTVDEWIYLYEEKQIGLISYEEGIEQFLLVVDIKNSSLSSDQVVWFFPLPAEPESITLNITKDLPIYRGTDISTDARHIIQNSMFAMMFTQIYSIPFFLYYSTMTPMMGGIERYYGIEVYDHVEKMGLTSELINAQDSSALALYLEENLLF